MVGGAHAVVGVVTGTRGGDVTGVFNVVLVATGEVVGVEDGVVPLDTGGEEGAVVVEVPDSAASAARSLAIIAWRRCCSAVKVVDMLDATGADEGVTLLVAGAT